VSDSEVGGEYLSARYVGSDPDVWLNGPDAVLSDMADYWMTNGREGRWPDGGWAHFTVTTRPEGSAPEDAESFYFTAVLPDKLFGTLTAGCVRAASRYVPPAAESNESAL
jgi:hypothetical protein